MSDTQKNIVVIGASGAIGGEFARQLATRNEVANVLSFSRSEASFESEKIRTHSINITDENSIENAASVAKELGDIDAVIVAAGLLHKGKLQPEKSLKDLAANKFTDVFAVNCTGPALVAKHFLPLLSKGNRAVFAALSARVGSISDNHMGGWYAYRASKAALNMVIKNAAIEHGRRHKQAIIVGLHPGTVDSGLSEPFQGNVKPEKLFTPQYAVQKLLEVIDGLSPAQSGKCFAWDGQEIQP